MHLKADPTRWVDEWPLPGLSETDRTRIKAALFKAHAGYLRAPMDSLGYIEAMQQSFSEIAAVLFNSALLTVPILENQLRLFVVEAAVAGGWRSVPDNEVRVEIFAGYFGHSTTWEDFNGRLHMLFSAEISEWHGKLLERYAETGQLPTPPLEAITPAKLLASYLALFPDERIVIRDLCWAAGQHVRELKRWKGGQLKAGSTPDLAFRRILTSGKRPHEFNKKPRPNGWE